MQSADDIELLQLLTEKSDMIFLSNYLDQVDFTSMSKKAQFAFWINVYNILTIRSVQNQIKKKKNWNGNVSLWAKIKFFYLEKHLVGGHKLSLYDIENKILRKKFQDPRLHFVINCASQSCPPLPEKLLNEENIEEILEHATDNFINNQSGVRISGDRIFLNKIFKWYRKDFKSEGGIIRFIKKYLKSNLPDKYKITFQEYNWQLSDFEFPMVEGQDI